MKRSPEEKLLFKAMEFLGQWPSTCKDIDPVYATTLRSSAAKISEYKPSDSPPEFLVEVLELLKLWPRRGVNLRSVEQLELRVRVHDLYDRWTLQRRLIVVGESDTSDAPRTAEERAERHNAASASV
jgi:hypothetical protein